MKNELLVELTRICEEKGWIKTDALGYWSFNIPKDEVDNVKKELMNLFPAHSEIEVDALLRLYSY